MKLKLSCDQGLVPGKNLEEKLSNLEKYGYQGIEFGGGGAK